MAQSDVKFEEKLTLGSKNNMRNLVNFNASSDKSDNLYFDVLIFSKVYYFESKKSTEDLCVITLKNDPNFEEKLTFCLKNDMRYLVNLTRAVESLKIWTSIHGLFFTAQKMKFSIKDFFSKCNQIRGKLRIWSHLPKKFLIENFIFCAVFAESMSCLG